MKQPKRRKLKFLRLREISAVTSPAQQPALASIIKRADEDPEQSNKKAYLTTVAGDAPHQHVIIDTNYDGMARDGGDTSYARGEDDDEGHSHPWVRMDDGSIKIGMAAGHTHQIMAGQDVKAGVYTSADVQRIKAEINAGPNAKGSEMDEKQAKELQDKLADTATRLERAEKVAELTDSQKAYFATLDDAGQAEFLGKSADERAAIVAKIEANKAAEDPVVYVAEDKTEYRKSDDPRLVNLAKERDADRAEARKARAATELAELTKRAETDFPMLPGEVAEKAKALAALRKVDKSAAETIESMLAAGNKAMAEAAEAVGHDGDAGVTATDKSTGKTYSTKAEAALDAKATEIEKASDGSLTHAQAYAKAIDEHPELYKQYLSEKAEIVKKAA